MRRIEAALTAGRSVIYDHANFLRRQRELLHALATRHCVPMRVIWVDVSAELATARWRRNRETGLRFDVRDEDFMQVLSSFEAPTPAEAPLRYDGVTPPDIWLNIHIAPHE